MNNEAQLSKTQAKSLATLKTMAMETGTVDVTFAGIKGVHASAVDALVRKGLVTVECITVVGRSYPTRILSIV